MKTLITAIALTLAATTAQAEGLNADEICPKLSEIAASFMEARQSGISMAKLMEIAGDSTLLKAMVVDAFEVSRYSTPELRARKIEDFRDSVYLSCYRELSR